ncbi:hypothetical protein [Acinetobacter johnsonii]|jgi:hypothetical protein|uniref:hypothetical protein n=1 Tax=Acinetobacter johnsonii TaxID=40214 RepID=UPI0013310B4E|nr:hypothetical protein [Acinetobacter johnsonii]
MSNTQADGNNTGLKIFLFIFGILLVVCFMAIQKATNSLGLSVWTGIQAMGYLVLWLVVVIGIYKVGLNVPNKYLIPVLAMLFVACFFPVLNDYALQHSTQGFHIAPEMSYLPDEAKKMKFGATKITVLWGMWYAKILYLAIAGLIGLGIQKQFFNDD